MRRGDQETSLTELLICVPWFEALLSAAVVVIAGRTQYIFLERGGVYIPYNSPPFFPVRLYLSSSTYEYHQARPTLPLTIPYHIQTPWAHNESSVPVFESPPSKSPPQSTPPNPPPPSATTSHEQITSIPKTPARAPPPMANYQHPHLPTPSRPQPEIHDPWQISHPPRSTGFTPRPPLKADPAMTVHGIQALRHLPSVNRLFRQPRSQTLLLLRTPGNTHMDFEGSFSR